MAMSARFRFVLSSSFALLGVVSCLAYTDSVREEAERVRSDALERFGGEVAHLVVADQQLEAGDVVSESNVRVRDWLADLAPKDACVSLDEVVGRELSEPVAEGMPLTELNFRGEETLSEVPAGHVAVSVPVTDKLGLSRGVARGSKVDAYVVDEAEPRLVATDIEVLSELGSAGSSFATPQLTVAVLPQDVAQVLGASASGNLRLVIPAHDVASQDREAAPNDTTQDEASEVAAPQEAEPADEEGDEQ